MNRRQFLRMLPSGLLVASAPTIFLQPRGGWPKDTFVPTPAHILADINRVMHEVWAAPYVVKPDHIIVPKEIYSHPDYASWREELKQRGYL